MIFICSVDVKSLLHRLKINFVITLFYISNRVFKQLAFGWQIATQLSGFNPLLLSNNKNYRLRKSRVFPFNSFEHKIEKTLKSLIINIDFEF